MEGAIIRLMKLVGLISDEKGICHGSGVVALQAFILGTEYYQSYIKRLEKIAQLALEPNNEALKHALESRDEQGVLKYSDILAHLQTVNLFQYPNKYWGLSNSITKLRQSDVVTAASMAQSQLAEKRGGIRLVSSFSRVYQHTDMEDYLTSLQKVMETPAHKETRCGLLLSSNRHLIMLGYDAANSMFPWTIDNVATVTPFSSDQCVEVGEKIREIFTKDALNNKPLILCTAVYSIANQLEKAKSLITSWHSHCEKVRQVTAEKAKVIAPGGVTWLFRAAEIGDTQSVELLLKKGVDINVRTNDGRTPLYVAAGNGYAETVKLLLENKVDVEAKTSKGVTALHIAAEGGYAAIVELLLEASADANVVANNGHTPHDYAVDGGHTTIAELLLEKKGADVSAVASNGCTPFIAEAECATMIKSFEKKADIKVRVEDNGRHRPVLLQRLFSFFTAASIVALGAALSFCFLSSTSVLLAIVFTTALVAVITIKYLPAAIERGYVYMLGAGQENKLESLSEKSVSFCEPIEHRLLTSPLDRKISTEQAQQRERVALNNSGQCYYNRLSV